MTQCGGVHIWHVTIFHIKSGLDVSTLKPELELIFFSSNDGMSPVANDCLQQMHRAEANHFKRVSSTPKEEVDILRKRLLLRWLRLRRMVETSTFGDFSCFTWAGSNHILSLSLQRSLRSSYQSHCISKNMTPRRIKKKFKIFFACWCISFQNMYDML